MQEHLTLTLTPFNSCTPKRIDGSQQGSTRVSKRQQGSTKVNKGQQGSTRVNKGQQGSTRVNKSQQESTFNLIRLCHLSSFLLSPSFSLSIIKSFLIWMNKFTSSIMLSEGRGEGKGREEEREELREGERGETGVRREGKRGEKRRDRGP